MELPYSGRMIPRIDDVRPLVPATPPQWMMDVKTRLKEVPSNPSRHFQPTIFRIHESLRSSDPSAYTPKIVSIGPFHFRRIPPNEFTSYLQEYKRSCVRKKLLENGRSQEEADDLLIKCLTTLRDAIEGIRAHYSADLVGMNVPDDELVELMLMDACFIITYLQKGDLTPCEGIHMWIWNSVDLDMLLLENQIPFRVIQILFNLLYDRGGQVNLNRILLIHFQHCGLPRFKSFKFEGEFHHFLHLFYSSLLPPTSEKLPSNECHNSRFLNYWIPSATELDRVGVKFRENKKAKSFLDITFEHGVLSIPCLHVSDGTNSLFRNLIAFEQCFPKTNEQITAYTIFMDCLVETAHDVNLLCKRGILVNFLSTNDTVADLFHKLTPEVYFSKNKNYLRHIFIDVNKRHQCRWPRYFAFLLRNYCHNPWAVISLVAASFLLLLTLLQTLFTILAYERK